MTTMIFRLMFCLFLFSTLIAESAQIELIRKSQIANDIAGIDFFSLATNTETGETLVVWADSDRSTVHGRIFNAKGKPITKNMKLAEPGREPSIAYNPVTHEYLLAYQDSFESFMPSQIYVQRLKENGRRIGSPLRISTDPAVAKYWNGGAELLFNPKTDGYVLFWGVHILGGNPRPSFGAGILLDEKGQISGPLKEVASNTVQALVASIHNVVYLPSADKFVGIYREFHRELTPYQTNYFVAVLDPTLKNIDKSKFQKINTEPILTNERFFVDDHFYLALSSPNSAIAYFIDHTGNLKGRRIDAQGKIRGTPFSAFGTPKSGTAFAAIHAAFVNTSVGKGGILIGTERDATGLHTWAQPLNSKGKPSGTPVEILTAVGPDFVLGRICALPSNPDDAAFPFIAFEHTWINKRDTDSPFYRLILNLIP